jgi:hypothetical protein
VTLGRTNTLPTLAASSSSLVHNSIRSPTPNVRLALRRRQQLAASSSRTAASISCTGPRAAGATRAGPIENFHNGTVITRGVRHSRCRHKSLVHRFHCELEVLYRSGPARGPCRPACRFPMKATAALGERASSGPDSAQRPDYVREPRSSTAAAPPTAPPSRATVPALCRPTKHHRPTHQGRTGQNLRRAR